MAEKKYRFGIINTFKKHLQFAGKDCDYLNFNVEQWAADALVESYGYEKCKELIEYYFRVSTNPSWEWFAYNAQKVVHSMKAEQDDLALRKKMREGAKKWLES